MIRTTAHAANPNGSAWRQRTGPWLHAGEQTFDYVQPNDTFAARAASRRGQRKAGCGVALTATARALI